MSKDSSNSVTKLLDPIAAKHAKWGSITAIVVTLLAFAVADLILPVWIYLSLEAYGWSSGRINNWLNNSSLASFLFVLFAELLTVLVVFLFIRYKHGDFRKNVGLTNPRWRYIVYALIGFLVYLCLLTLELKVIQPILHLNTNQKQDLGFQPGVSGPGLIMAFIGLTILPPIAEETVFRGFLYGTLRRNKLNKWIATIITSLIFASLHLNGGTVGEGLLWFAFVDVFTLSLVLCYLRERTGSVWSGMVVHALKNGLAFFSLFVISVH